jgi:mannose-1-phosphate guanylyltransferase
MKAVVLVGGEGTRLRPLTYTVPKQMLPVAGRTVIERVVSYLSNHGVTEVVLSLGYRPDAFMAAYPDGECAGARLVYAVETEPLDTAGAIAFAIQQAGPVDDTFVVMNGDVLTDIDVSELVSFHKDRAAEASIALTPVEDPSRFGVVPVDERGRVEAFIEKPAPGSAPTNMINAGIYVLEPAFVPRVEPGRKVSVEREIFPALVRDGVLYALGSHALWTDMGTPENYLEANLAWAAREGSLVSEGGPVPGTVHPSASVRQCVLAPGAVIAEDAVVEGSVVLEGARVMAGATVRGSVVGPGAEVGPKAVVENLSVLGEGYQVGPGEVISGQRLPSG